MGPPREGITTAMVDELSALLVHARCRRPRGELTYARQAAGSEPRGHSRGDHLQERHQDAARAVSLSDFEGGLGRFLTWGHHCPDSGAASAEVDQQECPAPVDVA